MIQLRRAKFRNFRLLRDVEIEFSINPDKPLTVVRAENDTGKTTLLNALTWCLFGDSALRSRSIFRIHPIDWNVETDGAVVPISVSVEFAVVDEETDAEVIYELERTTSERLTGDSEFTADHSTLTLLKHTISGIENVPNPTAVIESLLPLSLKDVFFIDGDRALAFIEATDEQRVKRERVENAVRALLGLDLLEESERHVEKARQEAVSAIKRLGAGTDVERLAEKRQKLEEQIGEMQKNLSGCRDDLAATETRFRKANSRLREALASGAGEYKAVGVLLQTRERELESERQTQVTLLASHRRLINSPLLTLALAPEPLSVAESILADLENRKVIPSTLPSVIEDRLFRQECICGASLAAGSDARAHLEALLAESKQIDESKELLRSLNDSVKRLRRESLTEDSWVVRLRESQAAIIRCTKRQNELEEQVADIRAQIRGMESTDLGELERTVGQEEREKMRLFGEIVRSEQLLSGLESQLKEVDRERGLVDRKNEKVRTGLMKETAAKDVLEVIRKTMSVLQGETIDEVSSKMNEIFLSMIIADKDVGSVVRGVALTREHDIVVNGPAGRTLDPDIDLNGASRRALTLAFILALVQVSGVRAPNIIDTPLGMMGVEVRQAVLKYAAMHSSQLVMFLTGSEILGVEELLDQYAGRIYTFTNATHFPTKLVNEPGTDKTETLVCNCNHRQSCELCRRRTSLTHLDHSEVAV